MYVLDYNLHLKKSQCIENVSPSAHHPNNGIAIPGRVGDSPTKNELSGESDPGYESDGTKQRLLILKNSGGCNDESNTETSPISDISKTVSYTHLRAHET